MFTQVRAAESKMNWTWFKWLRYFRFSLRHDGVPSKGTKSWVQWQKPPKLQGLDMRGDPSSTAPFKGS